MDVTKPQIALNMNVEGSRLMMLVMDARVIKTGSAGYRYLVEGKIDKKSDDGKPISIEYQAHVFCNQNLPQVAVENAAQQYMQQVGKDWNLKEAII